jgi:NADP-dependent 3-hydroxy acid dehydrogenase YdfG
MAPETRNDPSSRPARRAVVTGASSGFGAATARKLADEGFDVVLAARRLERLEALAGEINDTAGREVARAVHLDVTDRDSVEALAATPGLERLDLLVNNAGAALGLDRMDLTGDVVERRWRQMYELNVLGVLLTTRALLPALRASGDAQIVNVGSTAGRETYPGGGGYTASKHALVALTRTLRIELLGEPIRITEVAPGLAETEFSMVRFGGDRERADAVYDGLDPLTADDVADAIVWAATRPSHVNIDEIVMKPRAQATSTAVHRQES